MERLTISELIDHCDRQLAKMPSGNVVYQEHESVRAYLQILRHYVGIGTVDQFRDALRRTAEHDKAMEEGRLVELPCKVGDTVYIADRWGKKVDEFQVNWFTFYGEKIMCWEHRDLQPITPDIWGKTVFLTQQEAEAALSERGVHDD